jgi:hypothetical protein
MGSLPWIRHNYLSPAEKGPVNDLDVDGMILNWISNKLYMYLSLYYNNRDTRRLTT